MSPHRLFPALRWLREVNPATLRADALAGFSNAAIVVPQGVAFATIAGLPPEYGLYTAMVTAVIAAMWGSSMVMISGPTTAISALLFASLREFAAPSTPEFIQLALTMTVMVGLMQIVAGVARLGGLVSLVSHSVLTAFTAAAAVLIGVSQIAGALGLHVERGGNVLERLLRVGAAIDETSLAALAVAASTLGSAILLQKFAPRIPSFLIALIVGALVAIGLGGSEAGLAMVGDIQSAVPMFAPPMGSFDQITDLAPAALAIALVGLLEAISIGRAFAVRRHEKFDANQEMIGQGLSNAVGGFFQCYAGSGSFTRSGVNAEAGATTPLSAVFASGFLLLILLLFAPLIRYVPIPAMAGLILFVAWRLIDFAEIHHVLTTSRPESVILFLTLAAGLLIELDFAIYIGVIASFAVFVYESSHPTIIVNAPVNTPAGRRKFRRVDLHHNPECPQIVTIRLDGPLYFGSIDHVDAEIEKVRAARPGQKHVVLYLKGLGKIDLAGADFLIRQIREVRSAGGTFHIVAIFRPLVESLRRFHVIEEIGDDHLHISKGDAVAAALKEIDQRICAGCDKRVYTECDGFLGPVPTKITPSA
ncbi:SulP family inorganic anion transporter [Ruegeria sp. HKCCD8929]|uniref:SulP family inorganic anion transporter n=1 Tax=Ruegeria sp. HKCCD8929 TaxID=2683006 RepID=UPI001487FE79|nr:SulP family inorganic anion transporter [Ruegeria sp. HKCCD8929]